MSTRLGAALAEHLRRQLVPGETSFVLVEGVPASVAAGMSEAWDGALPQLAVVSSQPAKFGKHALHDVSGTRLRNQPGTRGVVLVLCDGAQVPDRQSLNQFESVSPSVLLENPEGMGILSQVKPRVDLDGPAMSVRAAINQLQPANRPSSMAVAGYLDRLAAGEDALHALPALGGFVDHAGPGTTVDTGRITDNLALAARMTSEDLLGPSVYADLRRRTEKVVGKRPGVGPPGAREAADTVISQLQSGDPAILENLRFDEAREILEQRTLNLSDVVRAQIEDYRSALPAGHHAEGLPWRTYEAHADALRRAVSQRVAAFELCNLDDSQQRHVFEKDTRRKLERLLRDKSVSGSDPSCPEAAIVRAAQQLGGLIQRVEVMAPHLPNDGAASGTTRTGAGRILTLACTRLRLGALMHKWSAAGGEVDGLLLHAVDDEDLGQTTQDILAAFGDAGLATGYQLPPLVLRLYDDDRNTVLVEWRPDLDDAAMLRAALLFADAPALTLTLAAEPTLHAFCGADNATTVLQIPEELKPLARALQKLARGSLDRGLDPVGLERWTALWTATCVEREAAGDARSAEALTLAGAVRGGDHAAALTAFAPLKAEWLGQYLSALWKMVRGAEEPDTDVEPTDAVGTSTGIARSTAAHHPAHLRLRSQDVPLLPSSEGRVWSLYGGTAAQDESGFAGRALSSVVRQLLTLQPEAAGHLRCLAWGPGAADLLASEAVKLIGTRAGRAEIKRIEIFCVGTEPEEKPTWETLAHADNELRGERDVLELRYLDDLDQAQELLNPSIDSPAVHLALITGLTEGGRGLLIDPVEVDPPGEDAEVLFAPRVWQRPRQDRRTLLMPPAAALSGHAWLRLQNAVEDAWPEPDQRLQVPEVRTGTGKVAAKLRKIHELALWVATLDRYVTRDSLEQALGHDEVAILHQEKRLGGDSPLSLVLSQKSGGPADRAIGRSLRAAGIVGDAAVALSIGKQLREVASQGYGILALQAATSGAGINELVGHVVAFSLLATTATPWPLPPNCRVLLVSLDEYRHWFPGKRADLLAIALDTRDRGVHIATIEVKARRSDEIDAAAGALDQLNQTLATTRWAAYPVAGSVHSRLWLNRIAEAAYAVARETRFKLDAGELAALEEFRLGRGSLEWAGVGLVFGPKAESLHKTFMTDVANDIVPVVLHSIPLTEQLLLAATETNLTKLRTVETDRPPLQGNRTRRRPEAKPTAHDTPGKPEANDEPEADATDAPPAASVVPSEPDASAADPPADHHPAPPTERTPPHAQRSITATSAPHAQPGSLAAFHAPILGWDSASGTEIRWHPAGAGQDTLQNGHVEIWGSSGMGKTQFVMSLLGQLSNHSGSRFGIADFKNDYSNDTGFPNFADAQFLDLWNDGAPYNPLALDDYSTKAVETAVIELRDTVEEAASKFTRMGNKQRAKLAAALQGAYAIGNREGRAPTLLTLDGLLDPDLSAVMGDLTHHQLFKAGEPLGNVIDHNVVFGLSKIPGNGQTTVLAAGFILSALLLKVQNLTPAPNTVRYVAVVDEAHRVADFKAVKTMIREGRSKGLAVVLATQQPLDLPDVVAANAQTKICFGLPDATIATMAARKLEPTNLRLPEQIRTLASGEAFVSLRGEPPRLLRMAQAYRDAAAFGLNPLQPH